MVSPRAFSVRRREPELVVPAKPTPREMKPLSDIDDQEGLREFVPNIAFYRSDASMAGKDPAMVIRKALADALVFYYPLAGRLVEGPNRKLVVDCTAEGGLFIEADADITLDELGDAILPPCPNLKELLYTVPGSNGILGCPLIFFQVTRLLCGGCIVAFQVNHTLCDALGMLQFVGAIGEIARGAHAPSILPVWRREILNARQPPRVTRKHHEHEGMVGVKSQTIKWAHDGDMVHKSFLFGPKELQALRAQLPPHLITSSTFEIITACLWICRTAALQPHPDDDARISYMVNLRFGRILPVPRGYYGNAFVRPAETSKAKDVSKKSLGHALEIVKKVKAQVDEEYVRSLADFMVLKGRPMHTIDSTYMVSNTTRIGFEDLNFGWGNPMYSGPAMADMITSFLVAYKTSKGEDAIVVLILLPVQAMERFQEELRKMTQEPARTNKKSSTFGSAL